MTQFASREVLRQFWLAIRDGSLREQAAERLGYSGVAGQEWFRQAGGFLLTSQPSAAVVFSPSRSAKKSLPGWNAVIPSG